MTISFNLYPTIKDNMNADHYLTDTRVALIQKWAEKIGNEFHTLVSKSGSEYYVEVTRLVNGTILDIDIFSRKLTYTSKGWNHPDRKYKKQWEADTWDEIPDYIQNLMIDQLPDLAMELRN